MTSKGNNQTAKMSRRSWRGALIWAVVLMAALLGISTGINLALGRVIHWDLVAAIGAAGMIVLALGRRFRWF